VVVGVAAGEREDKHEREGRRAATNDGETIGLWGESESVVVRERGKTSAIEKERECCVSTREQPKTGDMSAVVCGNRARIPHTVVVVSRTTIVSSLHLKIILQAGYHRGSRNNRDGISLTIAVLPPITVVLLNLISKMSLCIFLVWFPDKRANILSLIVISFTSL